MSTFSSSYSVPKLTSLAERERMKIKEEAKLVNFGAEYGQIFLCRNLFLCGIDTDIASLVSFMFLLNRLFGLDSSHVNASFCDLSVGNRN